LKITIYIHTHIDIYVQQTNTVHCLSSLYCVIITPLHVSGLFVAHHQEVECINIYVYILHIMYIYIFPTSLQTSECGLPELQRPGAKLAVRFHPVPR
jgi:NADH:ubiquinone oxidoreductase subunit 6 (subunit J)